MDCLKTVSLSFCLLCGILISSEGTGKLSVVPAKVEVIVGDRLQLSCISEEKTSFTWRYIPTGSTTEKELYLNGKAVKAYEDRLKVENDATTGKSSLNLSSVCLQDSGRYVCMEADGAGMKSQAEVIVLESKPLCQAADVITDNDCGIKPEDFRLLCSVGFSGSFPPVIECNNAEFGKLVVNDSMLVSGSKVTYTFVMRSSFLMKRNPFLCHTLLSDISANLVNANVSYVFGTSSHIQTTNPDSFFCRANSSQQCSYYWISQQDDIQIPGQSIVITDPGIYHCVAKCPLAGSRCTVRPLLVEYAPNAAPLEPPTVKVTQIHNSKKVIIIIVCVILGFVAVVGIGITFAYTYRMLLKSSDASPSIRFLWKIPTEYPLLQGLALLNGNLYVVHRHQNSVSIYQSTNPCKYLGKIVLEGLKDPRDVAACSKNACLYITDAENKCIWKVALGSVMENRDLKISAWVANVNEPYTVAVISGGRVLIAQQTNTLRIYKSDGTIFRTFQIKGEVGEPQHSLRTPKGTFIVSHGSKYDKEHRVCEVSAKGEILKSFGNRRGERDLPSTQDTSALIRLSHPRHLAIDESGRVLVVDRKNNRIIRLDKKLDLIEVLPCPGNQKAPVRLCCGGGRFLVARGNAVYFYNIDYDDDFKPKGSDPTSRKTDDESDSDDNTDDVRPPKRDAPERPLLADQFSYRKRKPAASNHGYNREFFEENARLRRRTLDTNI